MHKILIIEDEADIVKVLRKRLLDAGFEVFVAYDGYSGTKMAVENKPDLVILDLMLPGGHGLLVLKNLHLSMQTSDVPVIVTTGSKDEAYRQKIFDEGVQGFFEKPFDSEKLIATIKDVLAKLGK